MLAALWQEKAVLAADPRVTAARERWIAAAAGWLDDARCGLFVAERDGQIVGYIAGWIQPHPGILGDALGMITELALDAHSYQGGVGRALVDHLRAWYAERGVTALTVWASRRSAVEQAFWRSLGGVNWMELLWIKS